MAGQPEQARGDFKVVGAGSIWDGIAYWAIVVGVYLMAASSSTPARRS